MKRTLSAIGLAAIVATSVLPADAQITDHLKCYKIKDPVGKASYTADLIGGVTEEGGCLVKLPGKLLCVETTKVIVSTPPPPGGVIGAPASRYVCYKIKCPKGAPPPQVPWTDQFGQRTIQLYPPKMVCAPEPAPTTTTSTSSTTTTTGPPCLVGQCQVCGSCGHGECHQAGGGFGCGAPTTTPVCIDTSTCAGPSCNSDADCTNPARPACAFGGSTGGSACCAICF